MAVVVVTAATSKVRGLPSRMTPLEALRLLLGHVDYEIGNCRVNDMVGAALPVEALRIVRRVVADELRRAKAASE